MPGRLFSAYLLPYQSADNLSAFHLEIFGVDAPEQIEKRATKPVQPVWWLAPSPAPLSPWKYS